MPEIAVNHRPIEDIQPEVQKCNGGFSSTRLSLDRHTANKKIRSVEKAQTNSWLRSSLTEQTPYKSSICAL
jgi:hypothetical protein